MKKLKYYFMKLYYYNLATAKPGVEPFAIFIDTCLQVFFIVLFILLVIGVVIVAGVGSCLL